MWLRDAGGAAGAIFAATGFVPLGRMVIAVRCRWKALTFRPVADLPDLRDHVRSEHASLETVLVRGGPDSVAKATDACGASAACVCARR